MNVRILLLENSDFFGRAIKYRIETTLGFQVIWYKSLIKFKESKHNYSNIDLGIVDYKLPDSNEGEILTFCHNKNIPLVLLSNEITHATISPALTCCPNATRYESIPVAGARRTFISSSLAVWTTCSHGSGACHVLRWSCQNQKCHWDNDAQFCRYCPNRCSMDDMRICAGLWQKYPWGICRLVQRLFFPERD